MEVALSSAAAAAVRTARAAAAARVVLDVLRAVGEPDSHVSVMVMPTMVTSAGVTPDLEDAVLCGLVAPPRDSLDVTLGQEVEHLGHVQVLLHRRAEQLQASVASKFLDLVAGKKGEDKT